WQRYIVGKFRDTRERIGPWSFSIQTSERGTQGRTPSEAARWLRRAKKVRGRKPASVVRPINVSRVACVTLCRRERCDAESGLKTPPPSRAIPRGFRRFRDSEGLPRATRGS